MSTTTNALNNFSTGFNVDNLNINGNTITATDTNGNITLTPDGVGNVNQTRAVVGNDVYFSCYNTDNTNGTSDAVYFIQTGGASGGNPFLSASISGISGMSWGIDNSDGDALKETNSNAGPDNGSILRRMSQDGEQTLPLQPAFNAYLAANTGGVTGDGTIYPIVPDTELFDQGGDFATGIFTAPVTGIYRFDYTLAISSIGAAHTSLLLELVAGGTEFQVERCNPGAMKDASNILHMSGSLLTNLTAAQTAFLQLQVSGDTKTIVVDGTNDLATHFSGNLVC